MTEQEFKEYYSNLLIIQYHGLEKAKATIELLVNALYCDNIPYELRNSFSVDTAVGAQLDILGKYIGVDRFYNEQDFGDLYFGLVEYDELLSVPTDRLGLAEYSEWDGKEGYMLVYSNILTQEYSLDDDYYRTLLKMKIIQNNSFHSGKDISDALYTFFETDIRMSDGLNMSMALFFPFTLTELMKVALQKEVIPRPMGVRMIAVRQSSTFFGFSYSEESPKNMGFSEYSSFDSDEGEMLIYNKIIDA